MDPTTIEPKSIWICGLEFPLDRMEIYEDEDGVIVINTNMRQKGDKTVPCEED